ncbi:uncharacterized protein [Amphiura filiformis]|uniref:uncharacterized protein n=1 Tax=Amphiura filiformis TaxID=82378 RepID=UPI003B216D89
MVCKGLAAVTLVLVVIAAIGFVDGAGGYRRYGRRHETETVDNDGTQHEGEAQTGAQKAAERKHEREFLVQLKKEHGEEAEGMSEDEIREVVANAWKEQTGEETDDLDSFMTGAIKIWYKHHEQQNVEKSLPGEQHNQWPSRNDKVHHRIKIVERPQYNSHFLKEFMQTRGEEVKGMSKDERREYINNAWKQAHSEDEAENEAPAEDAPTTEDETEATEVARGDMGDATRRKRRAIAEDADDHRPTDKLQRRKQLKDRFMMLKNNKGLRDQITAIRKDTALTRKEKHQQIRDLMADAGTTVE